MLAIKARYNRGMECLLCALPDSLGTKFLDQTVPGCLRLLRPDIVILHQDYNDFLIDVACPCNLPENAVTAKRGKWEKYAAIKKQLEGKGFPVWFYFVGLLETWDPKNDHLLREIGIGYKYGTLFKKLCCHDAIW